MTTWCPERYLRRSIAPVVRAFSRAPVTGNEAVDVSAAGEGLPASCRH